MKEQTTSVMDRYDRLRGSYWFVPTLFLAGAILVAQAMLALDRSLPEDVIAAIPGIGVGSIDSARLILSTLAGSLITMTALVFSLTIVTLTIASSQFGPRLIRGFMRDRGTQTSLGSFTGTFLYCVLVLYGAESPRSADRLPHLSVAMAINFGVVSIVMLVYFIHNVSTSIHVNEVLAAVSREFREQIDRLFPPGTGVAEPAPRMVETGALPDDRRVTLRSPRGGYLRVVDEGRLVELARSAELKLELLVSPGDFVLAGMPIVDCRGKVALEADLAGRLESAFAFGSQRTSVQDIDFNIDQFVEIALRALSPGVNDPRTAVACIHQLGQNLGILAARPFPERERRDDQGVLRLFRRRLGFSDLLDRAFVRIIAASGDDVAVLGAIDEICRHIIQLEIPGLRREAVENFIRLRLEPGAAS